jgi:hypothetical protein
MIKKKSNLIGKINAQAANTSRKQRAVARSSSLIFFDRRLFLTSRVDGQKEG